MNTSDVELSTFAKEIEYLPYCIGSIRQNGVVSTSNRLLRPI